MHRSSGGRVTRLETIHLTLAFLGDVEEDRLPALKGIRPKGERHSLSIDTARYWKHNQIVWVGPAEAPRGLNEVVLSLNSLLEKNQFKVEERPFAAHVTLIRKARAPKAIPQLPRISWPVNEVVLVQTRLSSRGSSYETLQRYPLS